MQYIEIYNVLYMTSD